jgi:hypothetical protein
MTDGGEGGGYKGVRGSVVEGRKGEGQWRVRGEG